MLDYRIALFIHVLTVATWFGGTAVLAMYLRDAVRSNDPSKMNYALNKSHRWNLTMFIPTAALVAISGVYMLLKYSGEKALWLLVKERFGLIFVVLLIVVISFYGGKLLKQVKEKTSQSGKTSDEMVSSLLKRYILILNLSLVGMIVLIFFVTIKIG